MSCCSRTVYAQAGPGGGIRTRRCTRSVSWLTSRRGRCRSARARSSATSCATSSTARHRELYFYLFFVFDFFGVFVSFFLGFLVCDFLNCLLPYKYRELLFFSVFDFFCFVQKSGGCFQFFFFFCIFFVRHPQLLAPHRDLGGGLGFSCCATYAGLLLVVAHHRT